MQQWKLIVVVLLATALVFACASTQKKRSLGETIDDSVLTSKIKAKLLADKTVNGLYIDVDTWKGKVTLRGKVNSEVEQDAVLSAVNAVKGVKEIDLKLVLVSQEGRVETPAASEERVEAKEAPKEKPTEKESEAKPKEKPKEKQKEKKAKQSKYDVRERDFEALPQTEERSHRPPEKKHSKDLGEAIKEDTEFWTRPPGNP